MSCGCGLTLERWREILGYNPFHFWGLANSTTVPVNSQCNTLMREWAWQHVQQLGREDIREAIRLAEQRLAEHLHYYPYPRYIEEVIPLHRAMWNVDCWGNGWGCGSKCVSVRLNYGRVIAFGVEAYETLYEGETVAISDRDGDTVKDTFQIEILGDDTLLSDFDDIYVYPTQNDIPYLAQNTSLEGVQCKWLTKPLRQTAISTPGNEAIVIYGKSWQIVKPTLYTKVGLNNTAQLDPNTDTNYLETANILRAYTDNNGVLTSNASVIFEYDNPCHCGCDCNGELPYERLGQGVMKDARTGEVTLYLATYDPDAETWSPSGLCECRFPDRVRVRYLAGDDNGCKWDEVVARLAISELTRRPCGCDTQIDEFSRWYTDRALVDPNKSFAFRDDDLGNPFGTRAGAIYAWQRVKQLMMVRGTRV